MNNTPNPLVPQGSLQEQSKRKSQVRIIVFSILAIHVVLLGALLFQGCRPEAPAPQSDLPPPPTNITDNLPVPPTTNVPPPPPPLTNVVPPPSTPLAPADLPPSGPTEHVIQKGDTFAILAKKYGVSVKAIQQANPGVDPTRLKIGQKIAIPQKPPGAVGPTSTSSHSGEADAAATEPVYTVKKGDTLTKIAGDHGVSVKAIRTANGLKTDQIKPGQKLKLPAKAAVATAPAASAPALLAPPPLPAPPVMTATSAPAGPASPSSP